VAKDRPTLVQQNKSWEELERLKREGYLNGKCGAGIFHTGQNDPFIEGCKVHDSKYSIQDGVRSEADRELSSTMWKEVKSEKQFIRRNLLAVRATTYDFLVRIFGPLLW